MKENNSTEDEKELLALCRAGEILTDIMKQALHGSHESKLTIFDSEQELISKVTECLDSHEGSMLKSLTDSGFNIGYIAVLQDGNFFRLYFLLYSAFEFYDETGDSRFFTSKTHLIHPVFSIHWNLIYSREKIIIKPSCPKTGEGIEIYKTNILLPAFQQQKE